MAVDNKLETLSEEIKLMKGELKQSLASVRDYLLNMELPASEFAAILAALGNDNSGIQKVQIDGALSNLAQGSRGDAISDDTPDDLDDDIDGGLANDDIESPAEDEDLFDMEQPGDETIETPSEDSLGGADEEYLPEDSTIDQEEGGLVDNDMLDQEDDGLPQDTLLDDEDGIPEDAIMDREEAGLPDDALYDEEETDADTAVEEDEDDENITPQSRLPEEEEQVMEYDRTTAEINRSIPKVNMLANLINWVARAKREIGCENISTFLEVYGISGHLTPELKEVIIQLSEIASEQLSEDNNAEIWSQSMLSLHGILTGGDAPLHPVLPSQMNTESEIGSIDEEVIEVGKSIEKPVKLKLVFPNGDGKSKEFCINLTPEMESQGAAIELDD
jgi:hypothetical protein